MGTNKNIVLKGITWNHSRGFCPMMATAQRFGELHQGVDIQWSKRSLQAFANEPIEKLANKFDLLVIDHPWAGFAAAEGIIIPLNNFLPPSFLTDLANHSVGKSFESYCFDGNQFALPIDAATPVAASRPDLFKEMHLDLPNSWEDLLNLATAGVVSMPSIPIDTLMNFYMMCSALGEPPFLAKDYVISDLIGQKALEMLKTLTDRLNPEIFHWNPIGVYEAITKRDDLAYCPWAYGYANYSRNGYARKILHFHDLISIRPGHPFQSTLGGTGLAISSKCNHLEWAVKYAEYVASSDIQRTLFFDNGGQPGHRKAWEDQCVNNASCYFFQNTIRTLDQAYLRPRYNGYMHFQDHAGDPIRNYLMEGGNPTDVLGILNELYLESRRIGRR